MLSNNKKRMKKAIPTFLAFGLAGCGGGGSAPPPPPPPPPPPVPVSESGLWSGLAQTTAPSYAVQFPEEPIPYTDGEGRFTATFTGGELSVRGTPPIAIPGGVNVPDVAWHILAGESGEVTFDALPDTIRFSARTGVIDGATSIEVFDEDGVSLEVFVPDSTFQEFSVTRMPGESLISSITATADTGDIAIDEFEFEYSNQDSNIVCLVAETFEYLCVLTDPITDDPVSAAYDGPNPAGDGLLVNGSFYAVPGEKFIDGTMLFEYVLSTGVFIPQDFIQLDFRAGDVRTQSEMFFNDTYTRPSDLATIAATYSTFDLYGDPASFAIDANGSITSQSNSGCVLNGQVNIIDAEFNSYDVALDVSNCAGFDGSYDGLATVQDENAANDTFIFVVFSMDTVIIGQAVR